MAKSYAPAVLDGLLNVIKNSATRMLLVKAYTAGDSYAAATASANVVASVTMASGDYTLGTGSGSSRTLVTATKSATALVAASTSADDGHVLFTNGADTILAVTDETGELAVNPGDTVNFPAITLTSQQPT